MRPILYNANETAFETYGLGEIDATKAQVTRERNGNYTLYIEYPASGPLAGTFKNDMRIKSDAGLRTKNQTFFISRILKDSTGILKVYAKHISHLTETMAIRNNTNATGTAQSALAIWALNALGGIRFDTWSDIDLTSKTSWNIADFKTARDALGGVKGSILDVWGGEYEFDNTVIRLHKQLGRKSPTVLEYGRNILRAEDDQDIEGAYTSVYPYATYTPENQGTGEGGATSQQVTVELPEKYVDGPYIGLYNERRVLIVDFSSNFKDKEVPTIDKLRRLAKEYAINNRLGLPKINTKIEYVDLSKTLDYKLTQILEEAELCDIVPVYYPQIGLTSEDAKLTTIVYDVLLEQNDSVEVGVIGDGFKSSMTSNLSGKIDDLASNQQRLVNTLPDYLLNAQGNKVWYNRPDDKEHKVGDIWFEKNGIYDRMYVWNGSQWEKRIDTEDVDKIKKEVDKQISDAQASTNQAIAQADAKAEEALKKSGTLPDASKLSDQIKQQILNSPDLQNKVTEGVKSVDGNTIYSKIFSKLLTQFANKGDFESLDRVQNYQGRDLLNLSKQITAQTLEFNKLTESNKLYERILGTSETGAPDQLSRLVMSSQIFQTEVGKYVTDDNNLIVDSMTMETNTIVNGTTPGVRVSLEDRTFSIYAYGLTSRSYTGFSLPIYVKKVYRGETYTLGFKYRFRYYPDEGFAFNIKNHGRNKILSAKTVGDNRPPLNEWQEYQQTFTIDDDFEFGEDRHFPFYVYLIKNGWVEFKEPILVRGSRTGPYKPSQFDDAYKSVEATRTQVTQLAGSWAVKNLNSNGDVLNSINVLADGTNRIDGRLTHITGQTVIDNAVIEDGMIANVSANKVTAGTIDAREVNLINLNAKSVTSGTFKGLTFEGGIIRGNNGNTEINLNSNVTTYNGTAKIEFRSPYNSLEFNSGGRKAFLAPTIASGTNNAAFAFGVNDRGEGNPNNNFVGLKIFNSYGNRRIYMIGDVHIVANSVSDNAPSVSLNTILNRINDNFKMLREFRNRYNEGSPGFWDVGVN
jgi:phage minor structural protein, N-terminal domain protein|nr:MAG TPA: tail protein [Caudoviricetes sp.]